MSAVGSTALTNEQPSQEPDTGFFSVFKHRQDRLLGRLETKMRSERLSAMSLGFWVISCQAHPMYWQVECVIVLSSAGFGCFLNHFRKAMQQQFNETESQRKRTAWKHPRRTTQRDLPFVKCG
ncbi:hypothetical protein NHX12_033721 [Muraenolepis orangiensis]|uniref:Uncharacterized protein n=1 Tax=Muraenolepis orangiensis TaxID=630683 RepID=A0A9Q0E6I8_9TELE|nr:hypothetical protein NHX12_033721 [Muraenolepis orangiensis]